MKTFNLTNKQKQLVFLAVGFMYQFLEERDRKNYKNEWKLLTSLSKLSITVRSDLSKELEYAYKQLEKITNGKDIEVNAMAFAVNLAFAFAEAAQIDRALKEKIFNLGNKIFRTIDRTLHGTVELKNANELVKKFTRNLY